MQSDQLHEQIVPFIEQAFGIVIQFTVPINEMRATSEGTFPALFD